MIYICSICGATDKEVFDLLCIQVLISLRSVIGCSLTHSCLGVVLTSIICSYDSFKHNLLKHNKFKHILKGSCWLRSNGQISFKCYPKMLWPQTLRPNQSRGILLHEWVKEIYNAIMCIHGLGTFWVVIYNYIQNEALMYI